MWQNIRPCVFHISALRLNFFAGGCGFQLFHFNMKLFGRYFVPYSETACFEFSTFHKFFFNAPDCINTGLIARLFCIGITLRFRMSFSKTIKVAQTFNVQKSKCLLFWYLPTISFCQCISIKLHSSRIFFMQYYYKENSLHATNVTL